VRFQQLFGFTSKLHNYDYITIKYFVNKKMKLNPNFSKKITKFKSKYIFY